MGDQPGTLPARILVVEDTPTQAALARALLSGAGHDVRVVESAQAALEAARIWQPDAILLDLELPDFSGMEVMRQLRNDGNDAAVIVATANGSINTAVEAMREGAVDFLVKPYAKTRLFVTLANALEKRRLAGELRSVRQHLDRDRFFGFIGHSPAMQAAYRTLETVAASRASVFITGESGTGKELAAEAVHRASPRAGKSFVALNCGAIPRDLLESEVFGHVKGAFTGATADRIGAARLADGGTLFLDEICEMPLEMQVKLLRVVQTGSFAPVGASRVEKVDVRFVCATNRDPMAEVQAGRFREDLFYRLYVVPVELPALRHRGEDKLLIAQHFLQQFAREERRGFTGFSPAAEAALLAYPWPGNVRQLQNVVRNIVVLHDGQQVELAMLPSPLLRPALSQGDVSPVLSPADSLPAPSPRDDASSAPSLGDAWSAPSRGDDLSARAPNDIMADRRRSSPSIRLGDGFSDATTHLPAAALRNGQVASGQPAMMQGAPSEIVPLATMERKLIRAALDRTGNDVPRAAALLEINPSTIYRKLQAWRAAGL